MIPGRYRNYWWLSAVAVLLGVMYARTGWHLIKLWATYKASFGFVIVAMSVYMGYSAFRSRTGQLPEASPAPLRGGLVVLLGCLLYAVGSCSGVTALIQLSLVVLICGITWFCFGDSLIKVFGVPIIYLVFALPLPELVLQDYSLILQNAAAYISAGILSVTGMPVVREDHFLVLPHITLEVARSCNGINHIVALTSLAIPIGQFAGMSATGKMLMAVLAFILGIFLNGVRVAMIGWWSVRHEDLHGPLSTLFVSFIFFVGMGLLVLLTLGFARESKPSIVSTRESLKAHARCSSLANPYLVVVLLLLGTLLFSIAYRPVPVPLARASEQFPEVIGEWRTTGSRPDFDLPDWIVPDTVVSKVFQNDQGHSAELYIGYFEAQSRWRSVMEYGFNRLESSAEATTLPYRAGEEVNLIVEGRQGRRTIVYWYEVNGVVCRTKSCVLLRTAVDSFVRRRNRAAFVAIAYRYGELPTGPRAGELHSRSSPVLQLLPSVERFLN